MLDYKVFAGRNHFVLGQRGWEVNADYALSWINKQFAPVATATTIDQKVTGVAE